MRTFLRRLRLENADLFVLFILLLAGLKFTSGIQGVLDVSLYDESVYLHSGAALPQAGLPAPAFAPLYALWYYALSLIQPDRVALYYLNYVLTTVLPPLWLYVLLRINRVPVIGSTFLAAYFLITQANFVTWPRVTHFALLIVLIFACAASFARRIETALAVMAAGAVLASYARPEYFLSMLLLLALGAGLLVIHRRDRIGGAALALTASVVLAAVLVAIFGLPAFNKGGEERLFYAFAQHFAINWGQWNHVAPDSPFQPQDNFQEIAARYFGDATTVSAAWHHNPGMFAKHVLTNITRLIARFPGLFLHHENLFLPPGTRNENIEARLTLLLLPAWLYVERRSWLPNLRPNLRRHRSLIVCLGVLCLPLLPVVAEIYPHDHYLILPGVLIFAVAAILLFGQPAETPSSAPGPRTLALLSLTLLAATPSVSHRPAVDTPIARTIRYIHALGITQPVTELDAEGGYHNYQPANYQQVTEFDKHESFDRFRRDHGINMIVLTKRLREDSHLASDPEWQSFLEHYQEAGFEEQAVPGTAASLLIKQGLLPAKKNP